MIRWKCSARPRSRPSITRYRHVSLYSPNWLVDVRRCSDISKLFICTDSTSSDFASSDYVIGHRSVVRGRVVKEGVHDVSVQLRWDEGLDIDRHKLSILLQTKNRQKLVKLKISDCTTSQAVVLVKEQQLFCCCSCCPCSWILIRTRARTSK